MEKIYYCPECYKKKPSLAYAVSENSICNIHNIQMSELNISVDDFEDISFSVESEFQKRTHGKILNGFSGYGC